ncbi:MAG: Rieske 2Fe-2S domain-containing protein [Pigmentiphaga sp.]|nr:Rieske 2Fe-2S domain-containing protein [Pigmentiphaga sp.]
MSGFYRADAARLAALVQPDRVHRDVYIDEEVFDLEMERLWARSWLYVGHASQVPAAGDYLTTTLAGQPVFLMRQPGGELGVFFNRCAHKGAQLLLDERGNAGKLLRCPYHAWNYKLDGSLLSLPLKNDYEGSGVWESPAGKGLAKPGGVREYRGLVFARLSPDGPAFEDYFAGVLEILDLIADRSPSGELEVVGPPLRSEMSCNWKMYLENVNDSVHPISTHESAAHAAKTVGDGLSGAEQEMAMEQLLPFGAGYSFYTKMGARVTAHGHSIHGTKFSLHSGYAAIPGYQDMLREAHGEARAHEVLSFSPQNTVLYPSLALKASPALLRVLQPLAAGRTRLEVWALAPRGAPEALRRQAVNYTRLVFSPTSIVAHDDIRLFESVQRSLHAGGNEWISLHRGYRGEAEPALPHEVEDGNDELLMRNQFRAWRDALAQPAPEVV